MTWWNHKSKPSDAIEFEPISPMPPAKYPSTVIVDKEITLGQARKDYPDFVHYLDKSRMVGKRKK